MHDRARGVRHALVRHRTEEGQPVRSKLLLAAGVAIATALSATAVVGALLEWWWLVVAAAMTLLSAGFLAALDADRRVRALRPYIRGEVGRSLLRGRAGQPVTVAPPVSD